MLSFVLGLFDEPFCWLSSVLNGQGKESESTPCCYSPGFSSQRGEKEEKDAWVEKRASVSFVLSVSWNAHGRTWEQGGNRSYVVIIEVWQRIFFHFGKDLQVMMYRYYTYMGGQVVLGWLTVRRIIELMFSNSASLQQQPAESSDSHFSIIRKLLNPICDRLLPS